MDRPVTPSAVSVDEIVELFERWGTEHYDEAISQTDHALQCAALALEADAPAPLVAAALLHDVGHLLDLAARHTSAAAGERPGIGVVDLAHEARGARYLAALFGSEVTAPIALHVTAKRYLVTVDATYRDGLSDGSRRSLELQGGALSGEAVARFERHPFAADAVALRRWDDLGKRDDLDLGTVVGHRALIEQVTRTSMR